MFFVLLVHFYFFLCGNYIFLHLWVHETSLCVVLHFHAQCPLGRVHGCSLCSSSISTPSSVGIMFSVLWTSSEIEHLTAKTQVRKCSVLQPYTVLLIGELYSGPPSEIEHLTVKTQGNAVYYNPTQYYL